ncbi:hypothetical protein ACNR9V_16495 [Parageobacillus thermoglucosidasius]|uniref:hypothetical protein n=1 Tax=Parageobacillus thermoglucosidasius TaxID=1426 RepID=UPI003B6810D0
MPRSPLHYDDVVICFFYDTELRQKKQCGQCDSISGGRLDDRSSRRRLGKPEEASRIGRENARHSQNISARKDQPRKNSGITDGGPDECGGTRRETKHVSDVRKLRNVRLKKG